MIPLTVQTLIVSNSNMPSVLVMRPDEPLNSSGNARVIPIWIGLPEATQIGIALEHLVMPRPLTHDLFMNAIASLDAFIDHVEIYDLVDTTFYAKLFCANTNVLWYWTRARATLLRLPSSRMLWSILMSPF